jgi:histidinol dehydrogenase
MSIIRVLRADVPGDWAEVGALREKLRSGGLTAASASCTLEVPRIVGEILDQVRSGGDEAAARLTSQLDRAVLSRDELRVPIEIIERAHAQADVDFLALVRAAASNIREYQAHILVTAPPPLVRGGRRLGVRYTPVERVGVYVPGGRALYPSTVLMTVVPAQVAGVREIAMVSPPTGGEINALALALAGELGISEVYRLGGAVAVGALAFGTETIKPVDKLVGPGNAFVAEAKRQVSGRVGIDAIAGPSEVLIVADDSAPADWVAADLLAQAEHDPGSAILVTPSEGLAERVVAALGTELAALGRADEIRTALARYGAVILVENLEAACALANDFAVEHLALMTRDDSACLRAIRHAGAVFVGRHTPVPLGDYFAGPSHVLPTGGTARFSGPLSANDFLVASSLIEYDRESVAVDAPEVAAFARREGLFAHAAAAEKRRG